VPAVSVASSSASRSLTVSFSTQGRGNNGRESFELSGIRFLHSPGHTDEGKNNARSPPTDEARININQGKQQQDTFENRRITAEQPETSQRGIGGGLTDPPAPDVTELSVLRTFDEGTPPSASAGSKSSVSGRQRSDDISKDATLQARIWGALRESGSAAYTAFVDNTLIALLTFLRVGQLLVWLTPYLRNGYARLTGALYSCHCPVNGFFFFWWGWGGGGTTKKAAASFPTPVIQIPALPTIAHRDIA
jgi:hypothetical protein